MLFDNLDLQIGVVANDRMQRDSVQLQREVYCLERKFEEWPEYASPNRFDDYDQNQAERVLVSINGQPIATTRLIFRGKRTLPAVKLQPSLTSKLKGLNYVESSSFCASKKRRETLGFLTPRVSRQVTLLLILATLTLASETGHTHVVMAIERGLLRILSSLKIPLNTVGLPVEYHGTRQVCFVSLSEARKGLEEKLGVDLRLFTHNMSLGGPFTQNKWAA